MKVVCVTYDYKGPYSSFSIDKWVKIGEWCEVEDKGDYFTLSFDDGRFHHSFVNLAKDYFKTIDEVRRQKLMLLEVD